MGYEWIAAAAAATAAGIGNVAMMSKKRGTTRLMKVSKELAKYNNDLNVSNWQLQNEYDSPAAQMQRYKEAGLNPNLIYGQMSSGTAPAAGQVSTNPEDYMSGSDRYAQALQGAAGAFGLYQDLKAKQGQIDQSRAVTEQVQSQKLLNLINADRLQTQNDFEKAAFDYKLEGLAQKNAEMIRKNSIGEIVDLQKELNNLEIQKNKIEHSDLDKEVKSKQIEKIDAQIDAIYGNLELAKERNDIAKQGLAIGFGTLQLGRDQLSWDQTKYQNDYELQKMTQGLNERKFEHEVKKATLDTFQKLDPMSDNLGAGNLFKSIFHATPRRRRKVLRSILDYYGQ